MRVELLLDLVDRLQEAPGRDETITLTIATTISRPANGLLRIIAST
ncbi:MAG: hypothetical protein ACXVR1_11140 [Solirubrobacteraceae bacterium]